MRADRLLDWMTHHHLPLSLFREEDGSWVLVDNSDETVKGSGETTFDALLDAHIRIEPFPRRCETGVVSDFYGECEACGAANGEACLKP